MGDGVSVLRLPTPRSPPPFYLPLAVEPPSTLAFISVRERRTATVAIGPTGRNPHAALGVECGARPVSHHAGYRSEAGPRFVDERAARFASAESSQRQCQHRNRRWRADGGLAAQEFAGDDAVCAEGSAIGQSRYEITSAMGGGDR